MQNIQNKFNKKKIESARKELDLSHIKIILHDPNSIWHMMITSDVDAIVWSRVTRKVLSREVIGGGEYLRLDYLPLSEIAIVWEYSLR